MIYMESYNLTNKVDSSLYPQKAKIFRGFHKPHVDKDLREAIMKNPYLKTKKN